MMKGVNLRFSATNAASPVMRRVQNDLGGVQRTIRNNGPLMRSWNAGLNSNRRAVQQLGFQLSDFAIQVSGGQSAMLAFTQQGGQMLQFFGPAGAIMAALLAIFGSLAIAFTKSGHALSELFPLMGVLQDDFRALGNVLGQVKELMIDFANLVVNNLDVILIAAGIVAGFFAGKWVASWIAASRAVAAMRAVMLATAVSFQYGGATAAAMTVATSALVGAMALLRVALIYLGIPALIIGVAYLTERFLAMVGVVGSAGEIFKLLGDLVREVFERMGAWMSILAVRALAVWNRIKATVIGALADVIEWLPANFVNKVIGAFVGAFEAVKAVWSLLPEVFRLIGENALNGLINAIEGGLGGIIGVFNNIPGVPTIPPPDLSAWKAAGGELPSIAGAAADAFSEAFGQDYAGPMTAGLRTAADEASALADAADDVADNLSTAARSPLQAWQRLVEVWQQARDTQIDIRDWAAGAGDLGVGSGGGAGGGGGGGAGGAGGGGAIGMMDRMTEVLDKVTSGVKRFSDQLAEAIVNGKNLAEVFSNAVRRMAQNLISSGLQTLIMKTFGGLLGGAGTGLFGNIGSILFGGMFGGSYEGGGFTWRGPRSGGIDGRGGRLSILHPNETVTDHTRGGAMEGGAIRVYVDDEMRLRAVFEQQMGARESALNSQMPGRVRQINSDPYRKY